MTGREGTMLGDGSTPPVRFPTVPVTSPRVPVRLPTAPVGSVMIVVGSGTEGSDGEITGTLGTLGTPGMRGRLGTAGTPIGSEGSAGTAGTLGIAGAERFGIEGRPGAAIACGSDCELNPAPALNPPALPFAETEPCAGRVPGVIPCVTEATPELNVAVAITAAKRIEYAMMRGLFMSAPVGRLHRRPLQRRLPRAGTDVSTPRARSREVCWI
jgi:hypothetical protein